MIRVGTDNKTYITKYLIGDIVRISGRGHTYPSFDEATQALNVPNNKLDKCFRDNELKMQNWLITNVIISLYRGYTRILYAIKNRHNKYLIIGEEGIVETRQTTSTMHLSRYIEKNIEPIIVIRN